MAVPPRKRRKAPGDEDGGVRVERASDKPRRAPSISGETTWLNPREPLPDSVTRKLLDAGSAADATKPKSSLIEAAVLAATGMRLEDVPDEQRGDPAFNQVLAAVIIAQALDRLGAKLIDAAAVSRYRSGP